MGVRKVRDAAFWGVPAGTVIAPGMKRRKSGPAAAAKETAKAIPAHPPSTGPRPGSAAAAFAAGAGKGRLHARTLRPMGAPAPTIRSETRAATPTAKPRTARSAFDSARVADVSRTLNTAANREAARQAVAKLTGPQLRTVAKSNGVTIGSGWNVARIRDQLVESLAGRRLDSKALSRH